MCMRGGCVHGGRGVTVSGRVRYRGWEGRGSTQPVGPETGPETGPVTDWYCQGPTDARQALSASAGHSRPATTGPPHTQLLALTIPASQPIKARFQSIYLKVSLKSRVSAKSVHEAWHSPCFKNP